MLTMEAVTKTYNHRGPAVTVLSDVSLEIPPGDFVSIVGPSGSGKSTLLLALGGMLSPSSGRILLDGASLYDLEPDQRAALRGEKIGFVFQTFNLVPYLIRSGKRSGAALSWEAQLPTNKKPEPPALLESLGLGDRWNTNRLN